MPEPIVFVLDDYAPVRTSLVALFESAGLESRGFATAHEFLASLDPKRKACLVVDVELRDMHGLALQARLREQHVPLPIVFVTGQGDIATAVQAIRGGAVDFLEKPVHHDALLQSVRRALARDTQPRVAQNECQAISARLATLSCRQREILNLIVQGLTNRTMAERLGVAAKTIEFHRANIMQKMRAKSSAELIRMVFRLSPTTNGPARPAWRAGCSSPASRHAWEKP